MIGRKSPVADTETAGSGVYRGEYLNRVAFPLGGIGAGMVCLEGAGALSHVSLRHKPDVHHEPMMFAALHVAGATTAHVIEGPVPQWKTLGGVTTDPWQEPGNGLRGRTYGLPRFDEATFATQFPFGTVTLKDDAMPVRVELTGWSPFTPGEEDDSSLPMAALEYRLINRTRKHAEPVSLDGDGERFTFADRAYVRVFADRVEASGDLRAASIRVAGTPKLILNGTETPARVADGRLTF